MQIQGRGGGQVVRVLTFYSDDPSSIPAGGSLQPNCKLVVKDENKEAKVGTLKHNAVTVNFKIV